MLPIQEMLNRSELPLHFQISSIMRGWIDSGIWSSGERIPNVDQLTEQFQVARTTMRQSLGSLEREGLIWRKQGKGTFVSNKAKEDNHFSTKASWESLTKYTDATSVKLLESNDNVECPKAEIRGGKRAPHYHFMKRVHFQNGNPYCLIDIYLEQSIYESKSDDFDNKTVIPILSTMDDLTINEAYQVLTIGTSGLDDAYHLDIPLNSPVGKVVRIVKDTGNNIIYYSNVIYRGDFLKLDIQLL